MTLNGDVVELRAGAYTAEVATAGATLVSLKHDGRDVVASFDPEQGVGRGFQGRTLAPWPNRITGARYEFGGLAFEVPVNEPETGAALHGLALWVPWQITERTDNALRLSLDLPGSPGYPFDISLGTHFVLTDAGLQVTIDGHNAGSEPAPLGLSSHPYLTVGGADLDECVLVAPASQVLEVDDRLAPTRLREVGEAGLDLRRPTPLAGRQVDHAFTGLPPAGWQVELTHPDGSVVLRSDAPWVQLYSGEILDRRCLAVEPMTCPPDAFNGPDAAVALAPGQTRSLTFSIAAA